MSVGLEDRGLNVGHSRCDSQFENGSHEESGDRETTRTRGRYAVPP